MEYSEHVPIGQKTTMRIGGQARYYIELEQAKDCEQAFAFATEHHLPLLVLGGGSNTIFADGTIEAVVVRPKANAVDVQDNIVTVQSGKNLAMLINELAKEGLDLSALTGIPGSIGGAVFGNAGQGPGGIWLDTFVQNVTAYTANGWQEYSVADCAFGYRTSVFKQQNMPSIVWSVQLRVPKKDPAAIKENIQALLQRRLDTQPHVKTAGSCFKAIGNTPAWQLIDTAGLRSARIGDVHVSEKHANFLLNDGKGTFADAVALVQKIEDSLTEALEVEMRFVQTDGSTAF